MPKRKRQPAIAPRPAPRHTTRLDAERRNQVLLVALVAGVVVAALIIAVFGYYQTQIAPKGATVLEVEDRSFSLGYFERRARYEVRNGNSALLASPSGATDTLISLVQQEELIRRGAGEEGITLSEEDIDGEIRRQLNVSLDADRDLFAESYRTAVRDSGLSTADYREVVATRALALRLRGQFQTEVVPQAEQVRYRMIRVATPEEAQTVLDRLNAGEDFAALVSELSTDTASKEQGGEKPWAARGELEDALDQALFGLEPGQRSGVVEVAGGAVVLEVLERQASRDVSDEQRVALGDRALATWLEELRNRTRILILLDEEQTNAILEAIVEEAGRSA